MTSACLFVLTLLFVCAWQGQNVGGVIVSCSGTRHGSAVSSRRFERCLGMLRGVLDLICDTNNTGLDTSDQESISPEVANTLYCECCRSSCTIVDLERFCGVI